MSRGLSPRQNQIIEAMKKNEKPYYNIIEIFKMVQRIELHLICVEDESTLTEILDTERLHTQLKKDYPDIYSSPKLRFNSLYRMMSSLVKQGIVKRTAIVHVTRGFHRTGVGWRLSNSYEVQS